MELASIVIGRVVGPHLRAVKHALHGSLTNHRGIATSAPGSSNLTGRFAGSVTGT